MRLTCGGIVRNTISLVLIAELKHAGYVEIEEPVEIPAPEDKQETPSEKAAMPSEVVESVKKVKKVVKHGTK